ncbi:hypothetical protein DV735_g5217, partial [Chaetothyriales sp. CBS 134920]
MVVLALSSAGEAHPKLQELEWKQYTSPSASSSIMSALRATRAARVARSAFAKTPMQRRGYADAVSDKIKLSLVLPHQTIYKSQDVVQVNVPAESGEMGILAQHVPSIEQLKPGLIEVIEEAGGSKQFFLSGGFAVVQPDSVLSINAVEAYPLEDFSSEAVASQIAEAQKVAGGSGSEQDIAEAKIELEAFQEIQTVEDLAPRFPQPPRSLHQNRETSTPVAYGRQAESHSGTPSSQASRDGTDSARLPPGAFDAKPSAFMEERRDHRPPLHASALRPSTSLAPRPRDHQDLHVAPTRAKPIRRHRSSENMSDASVQLSALRARLRPHGEKKLLAQDLSTDKDGRSTDKRGPDHLENMIDYVKSSIEHQAAHDASEADSVLHTGGNMPESSVVRRWKSARGVRPSVDTSVVTAARHPPEQHQAISTDHWYSEKPQRQTAASSPPAAALNSLSPVRIKAAIFESMDQDRGTHSPPEAPSHQHIFVKKTCKSGSEHELPTGGDEELYPVDPRPSARHTRQESSNSTKTASFDTARQFIEQEHYERPKEVPAVFDTTVKPAQDALPRWRAFSKASSVTPQATEDSVMAVPERDSHYPSSRTSLVQSRIQGLLASSHQSREHDQSLKLRPTVLPPRDRELEIGEKTPLSQASEQDRIAFLQSSVEEQLQSVNKLAAEIESAAAAKASSQSSLNEKEVFNRARYARGREAPSQPSPMISGSPDKYSPPKAEPSTPRRGRPMLASLPARGSNYTVEQAFLVSPARSRSRSRASGSRMLLEVELRNSPGSEVRDPGERIMFIRADVNDIEEEDET